MKNSHKSSAPAYSLDPHCCSASSSDPDHCPFRCAYQSSFCVFSFVFVYKSTKFTVFSFVCFFLLLLLFASAAAAGLVLFDRNLYRI